MHCALARHFCSKSSQNKTEKVQYRSLKIIKNDYKSDYRFLHNETGNSLVEIKRISTITLGI